MGRNAKSAAQSSAPSPMVTTPVLVESDVPQNTATDVTNDGLKVTTGMVIMESTTKKRKVSFANLPTGAKNEMSCVASSSAMLASGSTEVENESTQKVTDASNLSLVKTESSTLEGTKIVPLAATSAHDDKALIPPRGSEKRSDQMKALSLLSSLQDILSDEESMSNSVSSLTSDTSSLSEKSTRGRKRGRGRRGRGRRTLNTKETKGIDDGGEVVTVNSRGKRWGRGRGGRKTPELTRSTSVETVEQSVTAEGE